MNKNTLIKKLGQWMIVILFSEISFNLLISHNINFQWIRNIIFITVILSGILTLLTSLGKEKIKKILYAIFLLIIGLLFATQAVFYKIFNVYFSLYDLALQNQLNSFIDETVMFIVRYFFYIVWFLLPFILFLVCNKKIIIKKLSKKIINILCIGIISSILINQLIIHIYKEKGYSTYDLIHNVNNISLSIQKLGVINTYSIEAKRIIFGFSPKKIKNVKIPKTEQKEEKDYQENKLELEIENTSDSEINKINDYLNEEEVTKKNKYSGIYQGYNLIYITAESFSEIAVRKDLTPTLYKLIHSGFVFKNFYTPNNLSTIGGEFQSITGLYPDYSILAKWREGTNTFPFAIANKFRNNGYDTYAYHNNTYNFQNRDQYIETQGFTNFLACGNGMEKRMDCNRWPQSDEEMMEVTKEDYLHNDKPFLAYYMTVSGHFSYTFDGNSIAAKNKQEVENLDLREPAKAYLATQIELDRALENIITSLEKEKKLDKTIIVLMADHYPYELEKESLNQLSSYERDDIEINHNALIIWNNKLEPTEINKPCMSSDVLPTIYNLFGIDYDSRLYTGKDILSTSHGIAILSDPSWITEKGIYDASKNTFKSKENNIDSDYINTVNQVVNNRLNLSRLIIEKDYYKYVKELENNNTTNIKNSCPSRKITDNIKNYNSSIMSPTFEENYQ